MGRFALLCAPFCVMLAMPVRAEEWTSLRGADITEMLTGRQVRYDSGAQQDFRASGRTLYTSGRSSWGYWDVRGDQYCSQWPPSDLWACYDMARMGNRVRFIGRAGDMTDGSFVD